MRKPIYIIAIIILHSIVLLFYCSIVQKSFAQSKLDSLQTLLQTQIHDTTRINTLNALVIEYISSTPDTALLYAERALKSAKEVKWQKGIGNAHHNVGYAYFILVCR